MSKHNRVTFNNIKNLHKPIPLLKNAKEPFQEKVHVSTWFMTLNSNIAESKDNSANHIGDHLVRLLENNFKDSSKLVQFLQFNERQVGSDYKLTEEMLNNKKLFPDIPGESNSNAKLSYIQEIGDQKKRVHLHAEFQIIHYTSLRMDYQKLQDMLKDDLKLNDSPFKAVYFNAKFVKSALPIQNYMLKNQDKYDKSLKKITHKHSESDYEELSQMLKDFNI